MKYNKQEVLRPQNHTWLSILNLRDYSREDKTVTFRDEDFQTKCLVFVTIECTHDCPVPSLTN